MTDEEIRSLLAYVVTIEIDVMQIDAETPKQAEYAAIAELVYEFQNQKGLSAFRVKVADQAPQPIPSSLTDTECHADRDGDCNWSECPQLKDYQSGCPLYPWHLDEEGIPLEK